MLPSSATAGKKVFKQVWENNPFSSEELFFSNDGTKIIVLADASISDYINHVYILDALSGETLYHTKARGNGTISHDGKYLAVMLPISFGKTSSTISLYDTQNFELYKEIPLPDFLNSAYSYKGQKVFFSADDKELYTSAFVYDTSGFTPYPTYGWSRFLVLNIESLERKEIEIGYGDPVSLDSLLVSKDGKYYVLFTREYPYYSATVAYNASTHTVLGKFNFSWYEQGYDEPLYSTPFHLSSDNKLYVRGKETVWIDDEECELIPHIKIFDLDAGGKLVNDCIPPNTCSRVTFLDSGNCLFGTDYKSETKEMKYLFYNFLSCESPETSPFIWAPLYLYDYHNGYYLAKNIGGIGVYTIDSTGSVASSSEIVSNLFVDKELLRFTLSLPSFSHCLIKIFDNSGKELSVVAEGDYVGENVFDYNIQNLPSGVYFLRVNDESFKFIVAR